MEKINKIPFSLFNSKALFNPYQYKPFFSVMKWSENKYEWNGKNLFVTDEVGVGKTFEAGFILQELIKNNHNISVLILCPVKLCENWEKEIRENFYISFNNYSKSKQFGQFNIIPYSYFSNNNSEKSNKEIEDELVLEVFELGTIELPVLPDYDVLILDEAHYIRNKGVLWKKISKMIENNEKNKGSKPKIFMTATPIFNSYDDYNNITELLKKNEQGFETTTTLQGEANCYDFMLAIKTNMVVLSEKEEKIIDEIYKVEEFEDDYGNTITKNKYGNLSGFLKRISASSMYSLKQFVNKKAEFDDYDELNDVFYNKDFNNEGLKKMCNEWTEKEDSKFKALDEILTKFKNDNPSNSFKAIIFSCFINTCNYLERRLKDKYNVYTITGKDSSQKVIQAKINFEKTDENAILICSDAAKEGHNLQFSKYLIHYDFPYTPAALGQRNGRIYRKGQQNMPEAYYMTVKDSYDERLFGEIIVEKTNVVKKVAGKNLISILNVLPSDSEDYIKKCIEKYFDDIVDERKKRWFQDKNNLDKNPPDFEREEFRLQLARKFSEMQSRNTDSGKEIRERIWVSDEYKNLYDDNCGINYKQVFVGLLSSSRKEDMEALQNYYKAQYEKEMKAFIVSVLGEEKREVEFKKLCSDYFNEKNITKENSRWFCNEMIENQKISISQYRGNFVPLIQIDQGEY